MESENEFDSKNNHPEERSGDDLIKEILGNDGEKEQEEKEQHRAAGNKIIDVAFRPTDQEEEIKEELDELLPTSFDVKEKEEERELISDDSEEFEASPSYERAPEGYLSASELSQSLGLGGGVIRRAIGGLGLYGGKYEGKNGNVKVFYSPEEQEAIIEYFEDLLSTPEVPEGYTTIFRLAESSGLGMNTIRKAAQKLGVTGEKYKDKGGRISMFYSPEDVKSIMSSESLSLEEAPENYKTANDIAKGEPVNNKVSGIAIMRAAKRIGIDGIVGRGKNGKATIFYSPEEQDILVSDKRIKELISGEEKN